MEDKPRAFADSIVPENETLLYQNHDTIRSQRSQLPPMFVRSIHPVEVEADSYLPQTASRIISRHIKSVWAHWYAVHWQTIAAFCRYTDTTTTWLRLVWGVKIPCGVKMMSFCHDWGWQPPQTASRINIRHHKVNEHIDRLSIGIG